jgi:hypothetical protein
MATKHRSVVQKASRGAHQGKFVTKEAGKPLIGPASQHVVRSEKGWVVRKSESSRADRVFHTKREAVGYAKDVARREQSSVYIHRPDGTIKEKDSYGTQPSSPRC